MAVTQKAARNRIRDLISGLPEDAKEILADLLPGSGYDVNAIALRTGTDPNSIIVFRRRIEQRLGVRFPRADRVGRPVRETNREGAAS